MTSHPTPGKPREQYPNNVTSFLEEQVQKVQDLEGVLGQPNRRSAGVGVAGDIGLTQAHAGDHVHPVAGVTPARSSSWAILRPWRRTTARSHTSEAVAFAVIDFITGPLLADPRRVGVPLRGELEGGVDARRGTYRVLHRDDNDDRHVIVLRVGHRRDVYRSL